MEIFSSDWRDVLNDTKHFFEKDLLQKVGSSDLIEHHCSRVKENGSITEKLIAKGVTPSKENALRYLTDIIGVRIVVHFIGDVYDVASKIRDKYDVKEEIDYIANPKDNGYRSLHMIVDAPVMAESYNMGMIIPVEIQIRTLAMDCWASLEHQMLYKKKHNGQMELAKKELNNCADALFSTDMKMEAIQNIIQKSKNFQA